MSSWVATAHQEEGGDGGVRSAGACTMNPEVELVRTKCQACPPPLILGCSGKA